MSHSAAPRLDVRTNYEYEVDLSHDMAAVHVLALVGENKRVLEIGAGSGMITRHLQTTNHCDVVALEIEPHAIARLREFCSRIYTLDLNDPSWADKLAGEGKFDAVVAADVLEHLYDPWTTLEAMKGLLKDDGFVVLSLPHAGHATLISCLLDGDFEYREWGLLDKTHIRFFGIKNIQALYERAGMAIEDVRFVMRKPEETEFAERWARLPAAAKKMLGRNRFGNVYQVVTRAVPLARAHRKINLADVPVNPPRPPGSRKVPPWLQAVAAKLGFRA